MNLPTNLFQIKKITIHGSVNIPVVPHKAVAEVSRIGNV